MIVVICCNSVDVDAGCLPVYRGSMNNLICEMSNCFRYLAMTLVTIFSDNSH